MVVTDFNINYLNNHFDKISKEQKSVFLLGDFNVKLLNFDNHKHTNEFLDSLVSSSFIPYIFQPTWVTSHSRTLIDNILSIIIPPTGPNSVFYSILNLLEMISQIYLQIYLISDFCLESFHPYLK